MCGGDCIQLAVQEEEGAERQTAAQTTLVSAARPEKNLENTAASTILIGETIAGEVLSSSEGNGKPSFRFLE